MRSRHRRGGSARSRLGPCEGRRAVRPFLVVNPWSAGGRTGRQWPEISARLGRHLGAFAHAFTERPLDASRLTARALHEGYECVVAVGGDGTVNEVVNGFFEDGRVINAEAALGVVGRGTGGDFGRTYGWDAGLEAAATRLQHGSTLAIDVGCVSFLDADGAPAFRHFANVCSFGVSGEIDRAVNQGSKALRGRVSFALGSLRALWRYQDRTVRVRVDGGEPQEMKVTVLAAAIGRYFGGGMCVAPEAHPADGLIDVTVWTGYGVSDFALKAPALYGGGHVKLSGTRTFRCKSLSAEGDGDVLLDVDGEQPGRLPCEISLLPGALRLKAGDGSTRPFATPRNS